MSDVEHGLLYEQVAVEKTTARDGTNTVAIRASYQVGNSTSGTRIHLDKKAAADLYLGLADALANWLIKGE